MLSISYLVAFFTVALLLAGCFFITRYFVTKDQDNWKSRLHDLEKEHKSLGKTAKRAQKQATRLDQEVDSWKEKFKATEEKYIPELKDAKKTTDDLQKSLTERNIEITRFKTDKNQLSTKLERMEKELASWKEKYTTDMSDSKDWKSKRERLNGEIKDMNTKVSRTMRENTELKGRITLQREKILEAEATKKTFRKLKSSNMKLQHDLAYWEKMHYEVHHKHAAAEVNIKALQKALSESEQYRNGEEIVRQNLMVKIEEFKTRFVNINNQYHELLEQHK